MRYFVTGFSGSVVPGIVVALLERDSEASFAMAMRGSKDQPDPEARFRTIVTKLELLPGNRERLLGRTRVVPIELGTEKLGLSPEAWEELAAWTDCILHGAADVRFDRPYEEIRVVNVDFTTTILALHDAIGGHRPRLFYIGTAFAYGRCRPVIPEDWPEFAPGAPENTYSRTKAEAKRCVLDHQRRTGAHTIVFEPTIIGGSSKDGATRKYNLFYVFLLLGFCNKLPFLAAPDNRLDIVPVDWVGEVIAAFMTQSRFLFGVVRLAAGEKSITNRQFHDAARHFYTSRCPRRRFRTIRFLPEVVFRALFFSQVVAVKLVFMLTRRQSLGKRARGLATLANYLPFMTGRKRFANARSEALIAEYTDCPPAPVLLEHCENRVLRDDNDSKGYFLTLLDDTLRTRFGGLLDRFDPPSRP